MDIGCKVTDLDMNHKLRLVHIDPALGVCLGKLAADILRKLDGGHGKALVAALALDLEALCSFHVVLEVAYRKLGYLRRILFAAGRPAHGRNAEHLAERFKRSVHVTCLVHGFDINSRLHAVDFELADSRQAAVDVADELLLKASAVESLEDYLAELEENNIIYHLSVSLIFSKAQ